MRSARGRCLRPSRAGRPSPKRRSACTTSTTLAGRAAAREQRAYFEQTSAFVELDPSLLLSPPSVCFEFDCHSVTVDQLRRAGGSFVLDIGGGTQEQAARAGTAAAAAAAAAAELGGPSAGSTPPSPVPRAPHARRVTRRPQRATRIGGSKRWYSIRLTIRQARRRRQRLFAADSHARESAPGRCGSGLRRHACRAEARRPPRRRRRRRRREPTPPSRAAGAALEPQPGRGRGRGGRRWRQVGLRAERVRERMEVVAAHALACGVSARAHTLSGNARNDRSTHDRHLSIGTTIMFRVLSPVRYRCLCLDASHRSISVDIVPDFVLVCTPYLSI